MSFLQIRDTRRCPVNKCGAYAVNKGFTQASAPDSIFLRSAKKCFRTADISPEIDSTADKVTLSEHPTPDSKEDEVEDVEEPVRKRKSYLSSELPLLSWIPFQDEYLFATLRYEGRGSWASNCTKCKLLTTEVFRCETCFGRSCLCKGYAMQTHKHHPLHTLKTWKDGFWKQVDMRELDIRVNLGHPPGVLCGAPLRVVKDFTLIYSDGIHSVHVVFCGCRPSYPDRQQLLDAGWWPATPLVPATAASFEALHLFDKMNGRGRISTFHFCQALEDMSNPHGLLKLPSIYESFKLITREYRYIKMRKRSGRGYDGYIETEALSEDGEGTKKKVLTRKTDKDEPGSLAIECRACPHAKTVRALPLALRWLNTLFVSEDANFRAKGRARSNDDRDPALVGGTAYVVDHRDYLSTISRISPTVEDSHCLGFNTMLKANEKRSKGLRATGIGMLMCSRHEMVRPQSIGDLQKGERYHNMDYLFLRSMVGATCSRLAVCYDIACQWSKNLWTRMALFPADMQLTLAKSKVRTFIPKFHRAAHVSNCPTKHTLNYAKGVGRTDGECTERGWSAFNNISAVLKELGPGGRHDHLDFFADRLNFRKEMALGPFLKRKMVTACCNFVLHSRAHHAFTALLRQNNAETVAEWESMVKAWEDCYRTTHSPHTFLLDSFLTGLP